MLLFDNIKTRAKIDKLKRGDDMIFLRVTVKSYLSYFCALLIAWKYASVPYFDKTTILMPFVVAVLWWVNSFSIENWLYKRSSTALWSLSVVVISIACYLHISHDFFSGENVKMTFDYLKYTFILVVVPIICTLSLKNIRIFF